MDDTRVNNIHLRQRLKHASEYDGAFKPEDKFGEKRPHRYIDFAFHAKSMSGDFFKYFFGVLFTFIILLQYIHIFFLLFFSLGIKRKVLTTVPADLMVEW